MVAPRVATGAEHPAVVLEDSISQDSNRVLEVKGKEVSKVLM